MATVSERRAVLEMLACGSISKTRAAKLLKALRARTAPGRGAAIAAAVRSGE